MYTDRLKSRSKSRSTSRKRATEKEKETRREEKEPMSTEDVEEVVMETKEKTIEPVEEVQQPMEEPEVITQENPPEPSQPEQTTSIGEPAFQEWMRKVMEGLNNKLDDNNKTMESMKTELNHKIEELSLIHI